MSGGSACDEDLVRRLPMPLAQLYRRAHNAKSALDRHDAAYYLWEASLKLLGSASVVACAERGAVGQELADRLRNLARPALGHWWEFVRLLVPVLADAGDDGFGRVRELLLGRQRDDLPRAAGLDAALREALDGTTGARITVRLSELFDRMVHYRNREFGHGAHGQRDTAFYDRMGRAVLLGTGEVLGRLDVLAGRRLVFVADVRRLASGPWLVERFELAGESPRRLESLERPEAEAAELPRPGRLYLDGPSGSWSLHPLVLCDAEATEVLFLNARRGRRRAEYLGYHPGRVVERTDLETDRRALLARILGTEVDPAQVDRWAAGSQAEEPPLPPEVAAETGTPRRRMGEFELLSELGRGGMGVVYRAWQPSLGRQVALKCLLRAGDPKADARFHREIHALGRVEHPHLIKVFTSGAEADQWFYTMELVEGATLAAVCAQLQDAGSTAAEVDMASWRASLGSACRAAREAERPLSDPGAAPRPARSAEDTSATPPGPLAAGDRDYVRHVVELLRQVATAAHALHEAGVVHRDIKPDNVLVDPDGAQAVLMDLGLAQLADESEGRLTRTRQFVGTLRYASPEQVLSIPLDRRSDVYSLGATLWELLTLRPLHGATDQMPTTDLMLKIQHSDPDRPGHLNPRVPEDLEAIVLKCLEKDRSRRYATAAELAADLGRWLHGEPVQAQPPTLRYMLGKYVRRHRLTIAAATALALAVVAALVALGTGVAMLRIADARDRAQQARSVADRSLRAEMAARADLAKSARRIEELEKERRLRIARIAVGNGVQLLDEGKSFDSLAWFADALRIVQGDPRREEVHRMRLATVLRQCPRLIQVLFPENGASDAAFSPDGRRIATVVRGGPSGSVRVWDLATGRPVAPAMMHQGVVNHVTFSRDGRLLVTTSDDWTARVWVADTGEPVTPPLEHDDVVDHAVFSPDARCVVTVSDDGTVRVWNAATGRLIATPVRHRVRWNDIVLSPDARLAVVLPGPDLPHTLSFPIFSDAPGTAAPPDDMAAQPIRDLSTGHAAVSMAKDGPAIVNAAFNSDSHRVVLLRSDGTAQVWDTTTWQPLSPVIPKVIGRQVALSPDGRLVLTGGDGQTVQVRDTATGRPLGRPLKHRDWELRSVMISPGGLILTEVENDAAQVWDVASGKPATPPLVHQGVLRHAAFSPDGHHIVTTGDGGTVQVWDVVTAPLTMPPVEPGIAMPSHADFSTDGQRIFIDGGRPDSTRVWDATSGAPVADPPADRRDGAEIGFHPDCPFSPDGRRVVTRNPDGTLQVRNLTTGQPLTPVMRHAAGVTHASFSPDGRRIVSASEDHTARVWNAATGQPVTPPLGHDAEVTYAAFSPNGRRVATAGNDRTARVWDAETGLPPMALTFVTGQ